MHFSSRLQGIQGPRKEFLRIAIQALHHVRASDLEEKDSNHRRITKPTNAEFCTLGDIPCPIRDKKTEVSFEFLRH